jgi:hypothetical protein
MAETDKMKMGCQPLRFAAGICNIMKAGSPCSVGCLTFNTNRNGEKMKLFGESFTVS